MKIHTLLDLERASEPEIAAAVQEITILADMARFKQWLEDNNETININFKLGGKERRKSVHPSTVSKVGACPLKVLWELTGEVEPLIQYEDDKQDIFDLGTAYHEVTQAQLHAMYGEQFQSEVKMEFPDLFMTGSADGLFDFTKLRFVLEIKTIKESTSQYGFDKLSRKPLPDHVRQATCYMKMLDVPFALLLYYSKNTSMKVEHVVAYDPMIWEEIKAFVEPIVAAANGGVGVSAKPGFGCRFCDFLYACDAGRRKDESKADRRYSRKTRGVRRPVR